MNKPVRCCGCLELIFSKRRGGGAENSSRQTVAAAGGWQLSPFKGGGGQERRHVRDGGQNEVGKMGKVGREER